MCLVGSVAVDTDLWHMQEFSCMSSAKPSLAAIPDGDRLVEVLNALANPHRLRIIAALVNRRNYVSQVARELRMSRPLLQLHLRRLESAGLVSPSIEVSEDGKAMKFYQVTPFVLQLDPETVAAAAATVTIKEDNQKEN
jgi:predicted transcriptional regulator